MKVSLKFHNLKTKLSWLEDDLGYKLTRENINDPLVKRQILRVPNWGKKSYEYLKDYLEGNYMNNIVLVESEVRELEQFGRYLENLAIDDDGNELRPVLKALDSVYKGMVERIKS